MYNWGYPCTCRYHKDGFSTMIDTKSCLSCHQARGNLAIPGRTEDGPGIDCLRMCHLLPRLGNLDNIVYMLSKTMTSQRTEVD